MVQLGKLFLSRLEAIGMSKAEFARRMGKEGQNLNPWFNKNDFYRSEIDKASEVLGVDFYVYLIKGGQYGPKEKGDLKMVAEAISDYPQGNPLMELDDLRTKLQLCESEKTRYEVENSRLVRINELLEEKINGKKR